MAHCIEIVFVSVSETSGPGRETLARLRSFAEVPLARFRQRRETVDVDLDDWSVTIEQRIGQGGNVRRIVARHLEWPGYRVFSLVLDGDSDVAAWIASDEALAPLSAIALEAGAATELECTGWVDVGASKIRATLCSEANRPDTDTDTDTDMDTDTLSLTAPFEAREALFDLAREVLQDLPFVIAPYAGPSSGEPVKAAKLVLPRHIS